MKKLAILNLALIILSLGLTAQTNPEQKIKEPSEAGKSFVCGDPLVDSRDGKSYATVQIGDQCWMAENLNIGTRINGSSNQTNNGIIEKYCYNNSEANCDVYGGLYQWNEVMQYTTTPGVQGICPEGWYVPTDDDWTALTTYVSNQPEYLCNSNVNWNAKALAATTNWITHSNTCAIGNNLAANNATGFTGLPNGFRYSGGTFNFVGFDSGWWSSTEYSAAQTWYSYLAYDHSYVGRFYMTKGFGVSVRCLRSEPAPPTTYNLNLETEPTGAGTVSGSGQYEAGEQVNITAEANPGWEFVNWTDEDGIEVSAVANFVYTMPAEDITLTANFDEAVPTWQPCPGSPTITDIDGNIYNTVLIDGQCWMKENLKTTKYRNGTSIEYPGTDNNAWDNNTTGAYAWYDNDISWKDSYGALYSWHAVNNANGLCPTGWYVPSDDDWAQLVDYVEAQGFPNQSDNPNGSGNALKSCRQIDSPLGGDCNTTVHPRWVSHGTHHGFDEFGFSSLPGGGLSENGFFHGLGFWVYWWASTEMSPTDAWRRIIGAGNSNVLRLSRIKTHGFSVRCLRDETAPPTNYNLNLETEPSGAGTVSGSGQYEAGEQVNITAEANPGWEFVNWTDEDGIVSELANFTYTMPAEDITLTANFVEEQVGFTCGDPLIDPRDGQTYNTVQIGNQCWMAENLNIGTRIEGSNNQTDNGIIEKYCYNNSEANCDVYGGLYQWDEMMNYATTAGVQGICPDGWYIPTDDEWKILEGTVDSHYGVGDPIWSNPGIRGSDAGKNLKSTSGWNSGGNGNDLFGFGALPGGLTGNNYFYGLGIYGGWWSSTESSVMDAWRRYLEHNYDLSGRWDNFKTQGISVRCLRDESSQVTLPTLNTSEVTSITSNSATSGGNVTDDGGAEVTARGMVWSTSENPSIETNEGITYDGEGTRSWVSELVGLTPATTYYVRAYAANSVGTGYGGQLSFTTLEEALADTINIIRGGPAATNPLAIPVQIAGVNANPYTTNLNQWTGSWQAPQAIYDQGTYVNNPDFWSNIGGLSSSGSTWHNPSPGNGYGILVVDLQQLREIKNLSVFQMFSDGKTTHIALAGHSETGNTPPGAFDAAWSEFLPKSPVGAGTNHSSYVSNPTKFMVNTSTRYVKIMAWNNGSLGWSSYIELKGIKMYTGVPEPGLPVVTSSAVSNITSTSAVTGGNITNQGGAPVTARGVVWSTSQNPTIETYEGITYDGEGTGSWVSELVGLAPQTLYYVRAYATNSEGTAYGNQKSFTTLGAPDLTLNATGMRILSATGLEINNPDPGETIFIEVTVYNTGGTATTGDVLVQVFLDGAPDGLESYDVNNYSVAASATFDGNIPAGGSTTLLLPWTTDEPERLALLTAAAEFTANRAQSQANSQGATEPLPVLELSYDNNMVARSLLIGTPPPGDFYIVVQATAPANMLSGIRYTLHGTANYSWGNNPAVLGALTTVNVNGVNYTTRTTSPGGNWSVRLNGLPEGSYTASITVYDGYLTGITNLTLEVNPGPPTIDLRIKQMGYVSGTYRIVGETGYALTGEPVVLRALVRNDGNTGTGLFDVAFLSPEGDTICVSGPVTLNAFSEVWVSATEAWTASEGPQTLKAYADSGNGIDETNENNNERSCILFGTDDLPDLRPFYYQHGEQYHWSKVSGLSFNPVHPLEYQPVTVSCDIYNNGTSAVPAGAAFEVSFSLGGEEFATNTIVLDNDLDPGASIQTSALWNGGAAGAYIFSFDADTENAIAELDEDNNNTSRTLVVYPLTDSLSIIALKFAPMQPTPNAAVNLTATVRNDGGLPGGNGVPVEFFVGSTNPGDKIGETILVTDVVPFGGMRNVSFAWTAPAAVGNYTIFAKINDSSIQRMLIVTNSPAPNLQVYSEDVIANPPYPEYGDTVSVSANVRNTEGSTAVNFMVHFFEDVPSGGWVELGSPVAVASLAVGSQISVDAAASLIANRAAYSIKVVLTPNPEQGDADYSDNQATSSFLLADAPVADAGEDIETVVGQTITLDGTGSSNAATYAWTLTAWPQGSAASLSGANTALPQLTPDVSGTYTARLIVSDGTVMSLPDFVNVYAIGLPLLSTAEVTGITVTTATTGGNIINDGGAAVTARGVVWSTSQNPTIETYEGITFDGQGTGSWVSELVGLTPQTLYYVRAYATNSAGTAYGEEHAFATLPGGPPNWEPNPYLQFNMQIIGKLEYENGTISMNGNDIIGAFVGEECRGIMSPNPGFMGIIFLTVGSDQQSGETVTFKAYLSDEDRIVDLHQTLIFVNQLQTGSIANPFKFTYHEGLQDVLTLQNITVGNNDTRCYEAIETIVTAGDGTFFHVEPGSFVYLAAGQNVLMKPGTHIKSGSGAHVLIDDSGEFCLNHTSIIVAHELELADVSAKKPSSDKFFRAFPNPTTGLLNIEILETGESMSIKLELINMMGRKVLHKELHGSKQFDIDLSELPAGVYILTVIDDGRIATEKIIRQ